MTTAEVLRVAREKIATPDKWTQRAYARSLSREKVSSISCKAICWCGYGAVNSVSWADPMTCHDARKALDAVLPRRRFPVWQDSPNRTHAEVLAVFDKAIAAEEAKGEAG